MECEPDEILDGLLLALIQRTSPSPLLWTKIDVYKRTIRRV